MSEPDKTNGEDKKDDEPVAASSIPEEAEQPNDKGNGEEKPDDDEE